MESNSTYNPLTSESSILEEDETQSSYIDQYGAIYYSHDIIFEEELHYLAKDQITEKNSLKTIKQTEPVDVENFIRYVREKHRLCWKEIYLKFISIINKAEYCKNCRQYF